MNLSIFHKYEMPRKITFEDVKEFFIQNNCRLLSTTYEDRQSVLEFVCSCGTRDKKKFKNFQRTPRCTTHMKNDKNKPVLKIVNNPQSTDDANNVDAEVELKKGTRWTVEYLFLKIKEIYKDELKIITCPTDITAATLFTVQCIRCTFEWDTNADRITRLKKGCAWCESKCLYTPKDSLYIVTFIGERIHDKKYDYSHNEETDMVSGNSDLKIWCKVPEHPPFTEKVNKHLSRAKTKARRTDGCPMCYEKKRIKSRKWKHNPELFTIESEKIHGKGTYDYSEIKPTDIKSVHSEVTIRCKKINSDGNICGTVFTQSIYNHIHIASTGCTSCKERERMTLTLFKEKAIKRYGTQFIYDLIEESDVAGIASKVKIKCQTCRYTFNNTTISHFLFDRVKRQCDSCNGRLPWTPERLKNACLERAKEGKYDYSKVKFNNVLNSQHVMRIICNTCRGAGLPFEFSQSIIYHFTSGYGCPPCSGRLAWTYDKLIRKSYEIYGEEYNYSLVEPNMIENAHSIIPIICNTCQKIFHKSIDKHIINRRGCTFCPKSEGSKAVVRCLQKMGIIFEDEKSCPGMGVRNYRYDYYFVHDGREYILEYDGGQHFEKIDLFHPKDGDFETRQNIDIYKQFMAIKNNNYIIRIDHTIPLTQIEFHITKALELKNREYFSTPKLYTWLKNGVEKMIEKNSFSNL